MHEGSLRYRRAASELEQVTSIAQGPSNLHPGQSTAKYTVRSDSPNKAEESWEEEELRLCIAALEVPERVRVMNGIKRGFGYLEDRITGSCQQPYSCESMHEVLRVIQAFDPAFAQEKGITDEWVDRLVCSITKLRPMAPQLKTELPLYLQAAAGMTVDRTDVKAFTDAVLLFWRCHAKELPHWSAAARIVFALSTNSCACERAFSLLGHMFGPEQQSALSDYLEGSLMLRFNKRRVG